MKALIVPLIAVLGLGACATNRLSDTDRLALYDAHAGAPVKQIRFYNDALLHIERLKSVREFTPQQLGKLFPDRELESSLASATAPNLLDNPGAEATREGLGAAFREARRERARAAQRERTKRRSERRFK